MNDSIHDPRNDSGPSTPPDCSALERELAAQKNRYLRLAADFDNFRKRTAQEFNWRSAAQKETVVRDLLGVVDNLERALASEASADQLREGVRMTLEQLRQLLSHHGIDPEECEGRPFDPHRHEAIRVGHEPSQPDQVVLETYQRGYRCGDQVFRPAKVVVNDLSHPVDAGFQPDEKRTGNAGL